MTMQRMILMTVVAMALIAFRVAWGGGIDTAEAKNHVGETNTVCGTVVSAHYAKWDKGSPTFLNLDKPRREAVFTVVVWGEQRALFPEPPEKAYLQKRICVTGKIGLYGTVPQIVVTNPAQITIEAN